MKVLVTGGYGFIGSHVAEKFFMEGHEVFIVDNLTTGDRKNVNFKHKFHQLNVEDSRCEDVFESNKFDVVIHLAAQVNVVTSMNDPLLDTKSNVLGLVNILNLSKKYNVKKVVFASSAAVYGLNENIPLREETICDPISPYGINKWVGEIYCKTWDETFHIDTLSFRFSNVYGPKQGTVGEGGVVSTFINQVLEGKELTVFGDGEQTRDFIYVKDVADAIYRGVEYDLKGIFNLSTNTELSINELIEALSSLGEVEKINYIDRKSGDINHSRLDNTKLKRDLDWVPLYKIEEGLQTTYRWFEDVKRYRKDKNSPKPKAKKEISTLGPALPYLENLGLFFIAIAISFLFQDPLYMIDYNLVYILVASFLLGRFQSILAIGLGIGWHFYSGIASGREFIAMIIDHNTLVHIGLYLFVGLTIGFLLAKKEKRVRNIQLEMDILRKEFDYMNAIYKDTVIVKKELEDQVLYTNNSYGTVLEMTKKLKSLNPKDIYLSSIKIVEKVMKTNKVSFFIVDGNEGKLQLVSKSSGLEIPPYTDFDFDEGLTEVKNTHKIYVSKSLDPNYPTLTAPILVNRELVGIINVYNPKFEYLTLYYQNLLTVMVELISLSLEQAYQYQSTNSTINTEGQMNRVRAYG
jgi:UDP-glucuronate decarboxylase